MYIPYVEITVYPAKKKKNMGAVHADTNLSLINYTAYVQVHQEVQQQALLIFADVPCHRLSP